jgi:hypothetical protein
MRNPNDAQDPQKKRERFCSLCVSRARGASSKVSNVLLAATPKRDLALAERFAEVLRESNSYPAMIC